MPRISDAQRRVIVLETRLESAEKEIERLKEALEDERSKNHELTLSMIKQGREKPLDFSLFQETAPDPELDKEKERDQQRNQEQEQAWRFWYESDGYSLTYPEQVATGE